MTPPAAKPGDKALEQHLQAMETLILSHIAAVDLLLEGSAAETIGFLDTQIRASALSDTHGVYARLLASYRESILGLTAAGGED